MKIHHAHALANLNWVNLLSIPISARPNLKAYLQRAARRPAVPAALRAEGRAQ